MVDTRARPTMRADDVCAVRRGLRIEFSRPNFPEIRKARASGRPRALDIGRATIGASMPMPMKMATAPRPTRLDGRLRQPQGEGRDAEDRDHRTDDDPSPRRLSLFAAVVDERGDRWDPHGSPGRTDGRDHRHPEAHDDGRDDGPGLEHERTRRQRDAEALEEGLEPQGGQHTEAQSDQQRPRSPRMAASTRTERNTCRRLAPTMRSSASSLVL